MDLMKLMYIASNILVTSRGPRPFYTFPSVLAYHSTKSHQHRHGASRCGYEKLHSRRIQVSMTKESETFHEREQRCLLVAVWR